VNKKVLIILASAAAISTGLGAGTFAWFTGQARSTGNEFKVGRLGISASTFANWSQSAENQLPGTMNLNNMQPGDERIYMFTVSNKLDDTSVSTLNIKYSTRIIAHNFVAGQKGLLEAARFDVSITGKNSNSNEQGPSTNLSFSDLQSYIGAERKLPVDPVNSGSEVKDVYAITIKLPGEATGNEYQGKTASFTFETNATQDVTSAAIKLQ
jgi:predicted ribosomally synthesized peptide with SipW-like signal peptide